MVNLHAKVAPSYIGANHLLSHSGLFDQGICEQSEIKKIIKPIKKHTSFINTADLSITNNFHFKNKTNYD